MKHISLILVTLWFLLLLGCGGGGGDGGDGGGSSNSVAGNDGEPTDIPNPQISNTLTRSLDHSSQSILSTQRVERFQERLQELTDRLDRASENPSPDRPIPEKPDNPFDTIDYENLQNADDPNDPINVKLDEIFEDTTTGTFKDRDYSAIDDPLILGFSLDEITTLDGIELSIESTSLEIDKETSASTLTITVKTPEGEIISTETSYFYPIPILGEGPDFKEIIEKSIFQDDTIEVIQTNFADGTAKFKETDLVDGTVTKGTFAADDYGTFMTTFPDGTVHTGTITPEGDYIFENDETRGSFGDGTGSATITEDDGTVIEETYDKNGDSLSTTTFPDGDTISAKYRRDGSYEEVETFIDGIIAQVTVTGQIVEVPGQVTETITETILYRTGEEETLQTEIIKTSQGEQGKLVFHDGTQRAFQTTRLPDGSLRTTGSWENADGSETSTFTTVASPQGVAEVTETFSSPDGTSTINLTIDLESSGQGSITEGGTIYTFVLNPDGSGVLTAPDGTTIPFRIVLDGIEYDLP